MSIWKETPQEKSRRSDGLYADIEVLELSPRANNCLHRAGCHTVADVLKLIGEDGSELRKIRNLGAKSEKEITEKLSAYRQAPVTEDTGKAGALIRPGKLIWDHLVEEYLPDGASLAELQASGVYQVKDLYREDLPEEPGWFAVRDLFAGMHRKHFKDRYIGNTRLLFEKGSMETDRK